MTVLDGPKPAFTLDVEADPLPWLTERFRDAGVFEVEDPLTHLDPWVLDALKDMSGGKPPRVTFERNAPTLRAMSAALGITSSIVTALSNSEQRFAVRFHPTAATAFTALRSREVVIGIRPMLDPRLTEGQRAALMVALAYHEVGHVIWTTSMQARVEARYGAENKPAMKVFNIVHDLLLEAQQATTYPGYAPTLLVKRAYWGKAWNARLNSRRNRYGSLVQATLYPQGTDWTSSPDLVEWFAWADDWAVRCRNVKAGTSPKYLLDLIDEGLARLRLDEPDEVDPLDDEEEERPSEPPTGEEDEDGEDGDDPFGDGDPDGDTSDPFGEDEDQPTGSPQPPQPEEDEDEWPDLDEPEPETGEEEEETGEDPATDDSDEESKEDEPEGEGTPTEGEGTSTDEEDDESPDEDEDLDQGSTGTGASDEEDDESPESDEDQDDDESVKDKDESGTEFDKPRDEFDDPRIPQPHVEDDGDSEAWQGRIDDFERVQVSGRDKVYVGGGSFHKREVRILRVRS